MLPKNGARMIKDLGKILSLIYVAGLISFRLEAIIVKLSDLQTMAQKSDLVIHGYVGEQKVIKDELGRNVTISDVEVVDGLFGAKTGEIIQIYQVGGSSSGVNMPIIGGQKYNVGQELMFFGLSAGTKNYVSFGAGQGKLDIERHKSRTIVKEDLGNVGELRSNALGKKGIYAPEPLIYSDLDILKSEIRQMLKAKP